MIENVIKTSFDMAIESMKLLQKQTITNIETFVMPSLNAVKENDAFKVWTESVTKFFPSVSK